MVGRMVVLLCGAPGSGKTTVAHQSGLEVFDRDDPQWSSESQFRRRIADLRRDVTARAVVIRSAASSSARAKSAALIGADRVCLVECDLPTCIDRMRSRGRGDLAQTIRGARVWFERFDRLDDVRSFAGWSGLLDPLGSVSREW